MHTTMHHLISVARQRGRALIYGLVDPGQPGALSLEEAEALRHQLELASTRDEDAAERQFQLANRALFAGLYPEAVRLFEFIARRYPDRRADCEGNIGVAFYLQGDYGCAIAYYTLALEHGAPEALMRENVDEARLALATTASS